ncbi:MmgE/PrpD family protein [Thalassotalea psychrophila]|uniref:MmgE/PrpD family protein n=1 Tax=Thalassotalea psychrophila TaxID=3065647 RepID=A0ABY9TUX5_9GAMM|nr:MmgE/PrpD family protein [Colwelliaceae bacterium SQ149]
MTQQSASHQLLKMLQRPVTSIDRARAKLHLFDWFGCAIYATKTAAGAVFNEYLKLNATGNVTCLNGQSRDLATAAFYNGALGNIMEMDDVHRTSILHPGPVVIPAALAVAESVNATMDDLLDAIINGYEAVIRLGQSVGLSHYQYYHNTSTCGVLGAAVASCHLLKLNQQQTLSAIGNALSTTGGLWQMRHEEVFTKQWHNAQACRSGVMAAQLASCGLTGPVSIIDGEQGLLNATSFDANPAAISAPHKTWLIHDCSFKPWPACRHAHPAMDALKELLKQHPVDFTQIEKIQVFTYSDAIKFCDRPTPATDLQAKFSIQHALAAWLVLGEPKLEHYQKHNYAENEGANHDLICLRNNIQVQENPQISKSYPDEFGAKITITLSTGQQLSTQIKDTLGDPNKPMSDLQISNKANYLMQQAGIQPSRQQQLNKLLTEPNMTLTAFITAINEAFHD